MDKKISKTDLVYTNNCEKASRIKRRHQYPSSPWSESMKKYATRVPGVVSFEFLKWCVFQDNIRVYILRNIF